MQWFLKLQGDKVWNVIKCCWSLRNVLDREGRLTKCD